MDCYYYYHYHGAHSDASVSNNNATAKKKKKSSRGKDGSAAPVKLSTDPQSVAARERRHRISEKFKALKCLVPGEAKLDTVSMLHEAIHYVKFLKTQIWLHEKLIGASAAGGYSESFRPQPESWPSPQSFEWSQSPMQPLEFAAEAGQSNSWVFDMDGVRFTNETTWL